MNCIVGTLLCVDSFIRHHDFEIHQESSPFLLPSNILLYGYTTIFPLSSYFQLFDIINKTAMTLLYKSILGRKFSFVLGKYLRVKFLGHR